MSKKPSVITITIHVNGAALTRAVAKKKRKEKGS